MRKRMILALLLAFVLAFCSGCSLIVKDPEVDKQTVIIDAGDKVYTKGEVQQMLAEEMSYQQYAYEYQYGMKLDPTDPDVIAFVREQVLGQLTDQIVVDRKVRELGYLDLSEEDLATAQKAADDTYASYIEGIISSDFADSELTGEELTAAAESVMQEMGGYPTREELLESEKFAMAANRLYEDVVADVVLTEEELQTEYNGRVDYAREEYDAYPEYYGLDVSDGLTVYYAPAGYRYVKHILFTFEEADRLALDDLNVQLGDANQNLSENQESLESFTLNEMEAESAELENQLEERTEEAYAALEPLVREVQERLAAGEDFDALMALYGQDPGMQSEPAMSRGYPVSYASMNWVAEFRDAAMALEHIGDVSEPVRSEHGIHLIKYVADIPQGPVAFEDVREKLETESIVYKKDDVYQQVLDGWAKELNVKVYPELLDD